MSEKPKLLTREEVREHTDVPHVGRKTSICWDCRAAATIDALANALLEAWKLMPPPIPHNSTPRYSRVWSQCHSALRGTGHLEDE